MFAESVTYPAALASGLLSFFSPCVLPLIPAYFTFITGYSIDQLTGKEDASLRRRVIGATVAFVLGFSAVFILMGASASAIGGLIGSHRQTIRIAGGTVIILLGLHISGLLRIRGLDVEKRIHARRRPLHLVGTFVVGMAFGAGWSPCIGPLLGSILILAGSQQTVAEGIALLGVYSAGLALPFLLLSVFIHIVLKFLKRASAVMRYVNPAAGVLLVVLGVMLVFDMIRI
ncbi:MAG: cytochrome c biogenesis protein CcdA [Desulfobacterales bacterium]|nr:cytochrome c biogenesis protein CcdA [Desulfobacterales bacterium]